jgi:hypothetical protein
LGPYVNSISTPQQPWELVLRLGKIQFLQFGEPCNQFGLGKVDYGPYLRGHLRFCTGKENPGSRAIGPAASVSTGQGAAAKKENIGLHDRVIIVRPPLARTDVTPDHDAWIMRLIGQPDGIEEEFIVRYFTMASRSRFVRDISLNHLEDNGFPLAAADACWGKWNASGADQNHPKQGTRLRS